MKSPADFFEGLADGGVTEILIGGVQPANGESDVAGPGIAFAFGSADQQHRIGVGRDDHRDGGFAEDIDLACRAGVDVGDRLVGGQDELVFDGQSFVMDAHGAITMRAPAYAEGLHVVDDAGAGDDGVEGEVVVQGRGSALVQSVNVGVLLIRNAGSNGLRVRSGGMAVINDANGLVEIAATTQLKVGIGAGIALGTGAGAFREVGQWAGNFSRHLEVNAGGKPTGDDSRICESAVWF